MSTRVQRCPDGQICVDNCGDRPCTHEYRKPDATGSRAASGPYIAHPPAGFVVDQRGYAWALWDDGSLSMVVSTPDNGTTSPVHIYERAMDDD